LKKTAEEIVQFLRKTLKLSQDTRLLILCQVVGKMLRYRVGRKLLNCPPSGSRIKLPEIIMQDLLKLRSQRFLIGKQLRIELSYGSFESVQFLLVWFMGRTHLTHCPSPFGVIDVLK
jgi:hypothetical protein